MPSISAIGLYFPLTIQRICSVIVVTALSKMTKSKPVYERELRGLCEDNLFPTQCSMHDDVSQDINTSLLNSSSHIVITVIS